MAYWIAAAALVVATLAGVPLGQPAAVAAATLVFIGGGLPHGAYDIALLRRSGALGRFGVRLAVGGYVAVALLMVTLWLTLPLVALALFLVVAAVHFGEDWQMLDEPLLRVAAGTAVIAAATIGHPAEVAALFVAMSDSRAAVIAQVVTAVAPVALLVTAVGIAAAWRDGGRSWASAMTLCFALLLILPPVAGFALFFVFLHSPRHLARTRAALRDMTAARWLGTGAMLSGLAIFGWWVVRTIVPSGLGPSATAQAFQLLASVAVPHLLLSRGLERRLSPDPSFRKSMPTP
ncbi:Brp/Blh family beta-carotene 15,15'-dioxygenase [Sphingomonas sp. A2-49]|uniref:Brp/Blh family beta-carotene 15,15'-dioxygenase n=1 Tax=Sphingomonas sp. A2-49 TaxID=1391375 RepID=UPI0021D3CE06|nr:Brp/Blh family beta-carotene 15,15'-dioxygenase [Sphingomonas sp. A2-49]MCU6454095.1 Brp/Blh family beta-carotene 15,15'-dioxygenase [Sphingomonas sp. A2-49]